MRQKYTLLMPLFRNGIYLTPPTEIELSEQESAQLLDLKAIKPSGEPQLEQETEPPTTELDEDTVEIEIIGNLDVEDAVDLIKRTTDLAMLKAYADSEANSKNRKTVRAAIEKQISTIANRVED